MWSLEGREVYETKIRTNADGGWNDEAEKAFVAIPVFSLSEGEALRLALTFDMYEDDYHDEVEYTVGIFTDPAVVEAAKKSISRWIKGYIEKHTREQEHEYPYRYGYVPHVVINAEVVKLDKIALPGAD